MLLEYRGDAKQEMGKNENERCNNNDLQACQWAASGTRRINSDRRSSCSTHRSTHSNNNNSHIINNNRYSTHPSTRNSSNPSEGTTISMVRMAVDTMRVMEVEVTIEEYGSTSSS